MGHSRRRVIANPLMSCGRCAACLAGAQNLCSDWRLLSLDRTEGCYQAFDKMTTGPGATFKTVLRVRN